jgi:hypothetical protein
MYIDNPITFACPKEHNDTAIHGSLNAANYSFMESCADNYSTTLEFYQRIPQTSVHIISNKHSPLDRFSTYSLLYAMLKKRAIILISPPAFKDDVDPFSKEVILNRLSKLIVSDISLLDQGDLRMIITNTAAAPVNYVLTKQETVLVKSHLRAYFRELLNKKTS